MTSTHWYRFFPGDYMRDTAGLSLLEHGSYRILLDIYYSEEQLTSDRDRLYRICRAFTPEEQAAINHVTAKYFTVDGDRFINKRAEEEIKRRLHRLHRGERPHHHRRKCAYLYG